ncbi:MAG: isochorismatase family protein, partial [bacterium]|nr:isochorismatase family protein [bacterium]
MVIVDAQIEYSEQGRLPLAGLDRALARIGSLLGEARDLESPVVHVSHQGSAGGLFDPTGGGRFLPSIGPAD